MCGPAFGCRVACDIATHPVRWSCADDVSESAVGAATHPHLAPLFSGLITRNRNPIPRRQSTGLRHDDPDHDTVSLCKEQCEYDGGLKGGDRLGGDYLAMQCNQWVASTATRDKSSLAYRTKVGRFPLLPASSAGRRWSNGPDEQKSFIQGGAIVSQFCGKSRPSSACRHLTGASHGSRPPSAPAEVAGRRQLSTACCQS